jgi:hypothetical protein
LEREAATLKLTEQAPVALLDAWVAKRNEMRRAKKYPKDMTNGEWFGQAG